MKKQLLLLGILSSASLFASTLTSDVEASKYINSDKETGYALKHRTNLEMKLPHDLEFRANLTYFSDFDKARFSLIGKDGVETGIGLTKKFGKYGDVSLDVKLDKTARLGYHNRYQINDNNKVYGGLEYQHKFINQKRGLKVFYEKENQAKYDNAIHYVLMANSGKAYLGLESKVNTKFGKFTSDVKLSNTVQYDNVKTPYTDVFDAEYNRKLDMYNWGLSQEMPKAPIKEAHKEVFSNQTELETKHKFTLNNVPVSFGLDTHTNVFVGRFDGDYKQDVLNVKSKIDAKVDYTYTKDTLKVIPELAVKNLVEFSDTVKYNVPMMFKNENQHIERLSYELTLAPAIKVEKDLGQGLSINGKLGADIVFNKLETELNKSSQMDKEYWKDFGYGYTNFKIGTGLKYTW